MALKGPIGDKSGTKNVTNSPKRAFFDAGSSVKIQAVWAVAKTFFEPWKVYQSTLKRQNVSGGEEPCTQGTGYHMVL